ncbi:MAG: L,D-transpeptidase family protein [Rhodobacter sp.]|nr:L,D-transpeptidase family protein [Paracoccaceae bacterium]MCC0077639.1 L,D-transpeptidase family protein [Rhodobacter sp.]
MAALRLSRRVAVLGLLAACARPYHEPDIPEYDGPPVTEVRVMKSDRRMELRSGDDVLRRYRIALGQAPEGHKERRGDSRTPEGRYVVDRRNRASAYHLSLGLSYPDPHDIARAQAAGRDPGGDIFIHGRGPRFGRIRGDWTDGCIAVRDREIEEIWAMVPDGTPVVILP